MTVLGDFYLISRSAHERDPSSLCGVSGTHHRWCFLICLAGETASSLEQGCLCPCWCVWPAHQWAAIFCGPTPMQLQQTTRVFRRPLAQRPWRTSITGRSGKEIIISSRERCCVLVVDRGEVGRAILHPLPITGRRTNSVNCIKWSD